MKSRQAIFAASLAIPLAAASAEPSTCEPQAFFETTRIKDNYAAQYAFLSLVTKENYEEMRAKYKAVVPGYFDGSSDEFETKRSSLFELINKFSSVATSRDFYRHTLTPEGAKAYAACIAKKSGSIVTAFIESEHPEKNQLVTIAFSANIAGKEELQWEIIGATPIKGEKLKGVLFPGSDNTVTFPYVPRQGLNVIIKAKTKLTGQSTSQPLTLPPYISLKKFKEINDDQITIGCKAGGFNGIDKNTEYFNGSFIAPDGWGYDQSTLREIGRIDHTRQHIVKYGVTWEQKSDKEGRVTTIASQFNFCHNSNEHEQGYTSFIYAVRRIKEVIMEEKVASLVPNVYGARSKSTIPAPWWIKLVDEKVKRGAK